MRKLDFRDLVATLIVAAVVVPFIGYSVRGSMPFVEDPRGMAGVGIVGGLLAFIAFGRKASTGRPGLWRVIGVNGTAGSLAGVGPAARGLPSVETVRAAAES